MYCSFAALSAWLRPPPVFVRAGGEQAARPCTAWRVRSARLLGPYPGLCAQKETRHPLFLVRPPPRPRVAPCCCCSAWPTPPATLPAPPLHTLPPAPPARESTQKSMPEGWRGADQGCCYGHPPFTPPVPPPPLLQLPNQDQALQHLLRRRQRHRPQLQRHLHPVLHRLLLLLHVGFVLLNRTAACLPALCKPLPSGSPCSAVHCQPQPLRVRPSRVVERLPSASRRPRLLHLRGVGATAHPLLWPSPRAY